MINVNVGQAAVAWVAVGAAALSLTSCSSSSSTAKGGTSSSASASVASVAATSSTAVTTTPSAVLTATATTAPSTTGGGAASAAPNPCTLVTAADVSAATGSSFPAGIHQMSGLYDACIYGSGPSLVILVRAIDRTTFDTSAKANPGGATPISGIGDDAYTASDTLLVWQAGTEIVIQIQGGSGDPLATEKKLAAAAVARL